SARAGLVAGEDYPWQALLDARSLWQLGLVNLLFGLGYTSYATFFPLYLVREAGFSQVLAGGVWSVTGTASIPGTLLWGGVADALGRRSALAAIFALFTGASLIAAFAPAQVGY